MKSSARLSQISQFLDEFGFASVSDLSQRLGVSEMTVRRDLEKLAGDCKIQRVYGGAIPMRNGSESETEYALETLTFENVLELKQLTQLEFCQSDVLIITSFDPRYELLVKESIHHRRIPIIAEALSHASAETYISIDDYTAGVELGVWAGNYALANWEGDAGILDLTFHLDNTKARSRGFLKGVRDVLPGTPEPLSLNAQSLSEQAYQLTKDALSMEQRPNIIFAINDTHAWGAVRACRDLKVKTDDLVVVTFGLEGNTLRNELIQGQYCKAGLAMFPEIVGRVCAEAAFSIHNRTPLPKHLVTPFAVLTKDTLADFYELREGNWGIRWDVVEQHLALPKEVAALTPSADKPLPTCIGIVVPFAEHEWYQSLTAAMFQYTTHYGVGLELIDPEKSLQDGLETRRQEIAQLASDYIETDDVIFLEGGAISLFIADLIKDIKGITVITNSIAVLEKLKDSPGIILISTGGVLRRNTMMLVGPTAENSLNDFRVDKLFLEASGVSFNFGISHTNVSEVSIKQTMIKSAREVILLSDHTLIGQESLIQITPITDIDTIITDDGLPVSYRIQFNQLGIRVIIPKP